MIENKKEPEIRFKGFTEDWEQRRWIDTVDISTNMVDPKIGKYNKLLHIGPGNIESFTGQFYDNIKTVEEEQLISGKFHFYPGDIIYGKINPQLAKYVLPDFEGLCSADSYILNSKNGLRQKYLYTILQTQDFYKYSVSVSMRSGIPKINRDELNEYSFYAPVEQEQELIGKIFWHIDNLITLNKRKYENLVNIKKSMLEKMFPKNSSKIPEIRFKGFTEDWEQRKLNDTYTFSQGMQVAIDNQSLNKDVNMEQFIRIIDVTTNSEPPRYIYNTTGKGHVEQNDIFFVRYGAVGTIGYGYNGTIANNLFKLSTKEKCCNDFMFQQFANGEFNKKLIEMSASTSMPAINFSALKSLSFYKTNFDEQIRIGKLFKSIDNLITLHQRKLEKLNNIKKSMLDKMFV